MYQYSVAPQAFQNLKKLPPEVQKRILAKLEYFISTPNPLFFAEYLKNHKIGQYRFRIGDYRVIFDVEGDLIIILDLGHRRDIYK